jgi:hypothetical protein
MRRILLVAALALPPHTEAHAQSLGCVERPVGPPIDATVFVPVPALPGARAAITVPGQPLYGQDCIAVAPPPQDILRGPPAPAGGLLRGDDGRSNLLRDPAPLRPPTGWTQHTVPR